MRFAMSQQAISQEHAVRRTLKRSLTVQRVLQENNLSSEDIDVAIVPVNDGCSKHVWVKRMAVFRRKARSMAKRCSAPQSEVDVCEADFRVMQLALKRSITIRRILRGYNLTIAQLRQASLPVDDGCSKRTWETKVAAFRQHCRCLASANCMSFIVLRFVGTAQAIRAVSLVQFGVMFQCSLLIAADHW